jgi:hypothetical protein
MTPNLLSDLAAGLPVRNWLVLGPFVIKTSPHFEREYMYERARILDIDYLEAEGGETRVKPALGVSHANVGLGSKRLAWQPYPEENLWGMRIAGGIIYETVQRNCVIYAAALIESDRDCLALLDAHHSGMKVWMNGALVCNEPYGLTKGVRLSMPSKPMRLRKGGNLLLIKFRPGYICDGVDFTVRRVMVSPLMSADSVPVALGRIRPTACFRGDLARPWQVVEAALLNTAADPVSVRAILESQDGLSEESAVVRCAPGAATPVRLALDVAECEPGTRVEAVYRVELDGRPALLAPFAFQAGEAPKHDGVVFVLSSFHFDTTYHEEQRVYAMGAFDIVRDYCRLHREDPHFRSIISEVDYLKPYADVYPEDRDTLFRAFREGRSEPDVMYNQPNEQTCGGEALVRNFLYGQLIHGRVFGRICRVYGPGDVFGHPNQLSQIARKSGCIGVAWDKHIFNFPPVFEHLALDGSTLPHKRGDASLGAVHPTGLTVGTGSLNQTPPTDWHGTLLPAHRQGTYGDYMAAVCEAREKTGVHLPVTSRDMALYHAATALSRTELKIANRLGENVLIAAEKFATIASLLGAKYPEKAFDKAWRQILCGQHHDSITGTHNELSFIDLMNSYREVLDLGADVLGRSLDYLGLGIDVAGAKRPLIVFNSLAWERTDVVHAEIELGARKASAPLGGLERFGIADWKGKPVPFEVTRMRRDKKGVPIAADVTFVARDVPSLGYRTYQVVSSGKLPPECRTQPGAVIENEYYRIEVDAARGGGIVSLYDKKAKREVIAPAAGRVGNELAILAEVPDRAETQHEFYTTGLKMFSGDSPAHVEVVKGAVTATLRIRFAMGELCNVVQEITLAKGVRRVAFRTLLLDVQREDNLYCVTFPTNLKGAVPVFDERFGVVARNDSRNYLDFRTHRQIMFSDCAVYAANKWIEYGSTAILQMGRNKHALSMVGLVIPDDEGDVRVAGDLQRRLVQKGVTCTPWQDTGGPHWGSYQDHMDDDLLYTRFRISLGSGGKNRYTRKLLAAQPAAARKAFQRRLKDKGFAYLFVKDGGLLDPSWPSLPVLIIEAAASMELATACEALFADFSKTATIRLPGEVDATGTAHTVDDYGVAVLNVGTYANSVERGGVICMMLNHTCRWYGGTNNFPEGYLVPENRNHAYAYALYPHAGTWREADTQRAAHEFNHPLLARRIKRAQGFRARKPGAKPCLPPEAAFLTVAPKNVILAAMKPFGNPIVGFERSKSADTAQGIMVRLYDTEGIATQARIRFVSGMQQAWSANLLEERQADLPLDDGGLLLSVPPFSIETVGFEPGKLGRKLGRRVLGAEAEPAQPVWVRSWEHDAESMPMGYGALVGSISRKVVEEDEGRTLRIQVNVVNDYTDAPVQGTAALLLPEGWSAEPAIIPFNVPPLGHQPVAVVVRRPQADVAGQIRLRYEYDGQTFQDVLEVGQAFDPEMTAENRGDHILVTLTNWTGEALDAELALVTPIETWPRTLAGPHGLAGISPRTRGVHLEPGESVALRHDVTRVEDEALVPAASYWAVAKLMINGRIHLKRCDCRPARRRLDDHTWTLQYEETVRRRKDAR